MRSSQRHASADMTSNIHNRSKKVSSKLPDSSLYGNMDNSYITGRTSLKWNQISMDHARQGVGMGDRRWKNRPG